MSEQDSLQARVAVLEVTVAMLRTDFEGVKRVIVTTGIMVVSAFVGLLIAANAYFLKQKDDIIKRLDALIQYEKVKNDQDPS